jgi:poly(3-hydroxybutyrate) depolymerase
MNKPRTLGLRPTALFLAALIGAVPGVMSARTLVPGTSSIQETVDVGGRDAQVFYIKKRGARPDGTQAPLLVLMRHAAAATDRDASFESASRLARDTGAWVLVLDSDAAGLAQASGADRDLIVSRLIDQTVARYPVDASRVYLTGFEGGADEALRFLCGAHEQIAAAAVVGGSAESELGCSPQGHVPLAMIGGGEGTWVDAHTSTASMLPTLWEFVRQYARPARFLPPQNR